ncbi:ankyrin repeat domain-containing protein 29-like [Haliotis asinina]|uniref:ankyrin repeat domain-containing protein 29-like n=1 Tax=Haliotis asinina TaxID=109174 RepID=UPI0035327087
MTTFTMKAILKARTETEALRPGPTQMSDVPATSRDTGKSGSPTRPETRATPTPARRDARADAVLHDACREGNLEEVKRILDTGRADVNSRRGVGMTPVMAAALRRHRDVVELLVSRGADVSLVTDDGNNILHLACVRGDRETVEFVLSLDGVDVNARNNAGQTAADVARGRGHRQLSDLLLSRGTQ